jgi:hypothetical protein
MDDIFWLSSDIRFEERLTHASSMRLVTEPCRFETDHTVRQRWSRPLRVIGPVRQLTDFEWSVYGDAITSPAVACGFRDAGFTGFEVLPTEILTTTETPIGREAVQLKVYGWGGVAPQSSGVRVLSECKACGRRVFSKYTSPERLFTRTQWDGSDFFVIWPLPGYIMITLKVRNHLLAAGYSGIKVRPLSELPMGPGHTLTPGHLEDWLDKERVAAMLDRGLTI